MPTSREAHLRYSLYYKGLLREASSFYCEGGEGAQHGIDLYVANEEHILAGQRWAEGQAEQDPEASRCCSDYSTAGMLLLTLRQPARATPLAPSLALRCQPAGRPFLRVAAHGEHGRCLLRTRCH